MQKLFLKRFLMQFLLFLFLSLKVLFKASFLYLHHLIVFRVKAQYFQTFSKSHSVICFSKGQIKQPFCIFHSNKRYACCLFWDSKKLYSRKHKTACVIREYWLERKEKLRKTGKG